MWCLSKLLLHQDLGSPASTSGELAVGELHWQATVIIIPEAIFVAFKLFTFSCDEWFDPWPEIYSNKTFGYLLTCLF